VQGTLENVVRIGGDDKTVGGKPHAHGRFGGENIAEVSGGNDV
jgi:hypothetical protein